MSSNQPPPPGGPHPYGQQPGAQGWGQPNQPPGQPAPASGQPSWGPPGQPPNGPGQTEWLSSGQPPGGGSGGRRRGWIVAGVTALTLVIAGGAVAAYQFLGGGGPQPAEALPGSAIAYTRIDLDPSAEQKVAVLRLLRRVPQFEEETGITSDKEDLRQLIVEEFLADSECDDLSYDDDFAPWIGDRAGFAVMVVDGEPQPVVSIQVNDRSEAEDAVQALSACSGLASGSGSVSSTDPETTEDTPEDTGVEFVGDYMLIAETQDLAADFAAEAESSPLSDNESFNEATDQLGDQGVASFWVDVDALLEVPELQEGAELESMMVGLEEIHSYAGAFRAGDDYLEMAVSVNSDIEISDEDDNPVVNLPEGTVGAISVSNGGDYVDMGFEQLREFSEQMSPGSFDSEITQFEAESGLMLPEDLQTVFGDNVTAALDSEGLTPEALQSPADIPNIGLGVRFTTDPAAIQDVLDRVQAKLGESGAPFTLATQETDDGLVVATNEDYAASLADDGELGDSDAFADAVPDAEDAEAVFFVDLDKVTQIASDFDAEDDAAPLEPMRAFGMSVQQGDDGFTQAIFRLTFD